MNFASTEHYSSFSLGNELDGCKTLKCGPIAMANQLWFNSSKPTLLLKKTKRKVSDFVMLAMMWILETKILKLLQDRIDGVGDVMAMISWWSEQNDEAYMR